MIGGAMGISGAYVTFFPLDSSYAKWIFLGAFVLLTTALVRSSLERERLAVEAQNARERSFDLKLENVHEDVAELAAAGDVGSHRTRLSRQALRNQTTGLATELEAFLRDRLKDPIGDDQLQALHQWHFENGQIYATRYASRVKNVVNEIAREGVADDNLIAEGNAPYPVHTSTICALPVLLKRAANRL